MSRYAGVLARARPRPRAAARVGQSPCWRRTLATELSPGARVHGFRVQAVDHNPSLQLKATTLVHECTGAQHLHIHRDDTNGAFNVVFRTIPTDSTGVPHILEHTTLCGSSKYPVRDPFFKMLTRSMSTFMNAMTGNDYTMYPFATQNANDFKNLLGVYLDATFHPLLSYQDFRQEGWRLEHAVASDPATALAFKGVVFTEMKGYMSDPQSFFMTRLQQALRPNTTYAHSSGGDPINIVDLTYEQLRAFHARHYHPSNARFYTYGNLDLAPILEQIDQSISARTDPPVPVMDVSKTVRFDAPRMVHAYGPPDPIGEPSRPVRATVAFLTTDLLEMNKTFAMRILSTLLTEGPAAPLHKALFESQLGSDYAPGTGFSDDARDTSFSVGMQGLASVEDAKQIESIVLQTLAQVAAEGFSSERIEAALHQVELSLKHQSSLFGVNVGMNIAGSWAHGANPVDLLDYDQKLAYVREQVSHGRFFERLVETELLNNPHRLLFVVTSSPDFPLTEAQHEQSKLLKATSALTDADRQRILAESQQLLQMQNAEQDLSCLPILRVADVSRDVVRYAVTPHQIAGVPVYKTQQPTNGVTYVRGLLTLQQLGADLQPFLSLYCSALTWMGTKTRDKARYALDVDRYTGGIQVSPEVLVDPHDLNRGTLGVYFSTLALDGNIERLAELLTDTLCNPSYDDIAHLKNLIKMTASNLASSIAESGHSYAQSHAAAALSQPLALSEMLQGLTHVQFMESLAANEPMEDVVDKLKQIHAIVTTSNTNLSMLVNATATSLSTTDSHLTRLLSSLHSKPSVPSPVMPFANSPPLRSHKQTLLPMPLQVNYTSKAVKTVSYTHPDSAVLQICAKLMSSGFLHREIREKGGAYGSGAAWSDGMVTFMSYRDPNTLKTIETFDRAVAWLAGSGFVDRQIEEAKLSLLGQMDMPAAPGDRTVTQFKHGITDDMRQRRRNVVFDTDRAAIVRAAEKWLVPAISNPGTSATTILASEAVLQQDPVMLEQAQKHGWHIAN